MALNLVKGQIEPIASTISKLRVGLGWEPNESLSSHDFDLDVSAFLVSPSGKVLNENYLVFYNSELRVHPNRLNKLEPQNSSIYLPYIDKNGKSIDSKECHRLKTRPVDPDFALWGSIDDTDGTESDGGDDETMDIDLNRVSANVKEIIIAVSIYEFDKRQQNFGQVDDSYISIYDDSSGSLLFKYELNDNFSTNTAIEFCRIYRKDGQWKVQATGIGYNDGLNGPISKYI